MILDEPTAGVDHELRHEPWSYLRRLHHDEHVTVLLTTHYLQEAQGLCERVAFIRSGQILAEGSSTELSACYAGSDLQDAYHEAEHSNPNEHPADNKPNGDPTSVTSAMGTRCASGSAHSARDTPMG